MKPKTLKDWEKEFREVGRAAASTDDRSDIECVISYAANCLMSEKRKSYEEGVRDFEGELNGLRPKIISDLLIYSGLKK